MSVNGPSFEYQLKKLIELAIDKAFEDGYALAEKELRDTFGYDDGYQAGYADGLKDEPND